MSKKDFVECPICGEYMYFIGYRNYDKDLLEIHSCSKCEQRIFKNGSRTVVQNNLSNNKQSK